MAQLISGLDAVYRSKRNSWQDTTVPPNVLLHLFGPLEASLDLQTFVDVPQIRHRESMKGQTTDIPNIAFLLQLPAFLLLIPRDQSTDMRGHNDSMRGQVGDPQNFILPAAIFNPAVGQPGSVVINPVFNKHPTQETEIRRNPVLDIISTTQPTIPSQFLDEQSYRRDSLQGQYGRSGAIVPLGVPPAFNEIYTFVPKPKGAQEPYIFPNRLIIVLPPNPPPFVQPQSEDHQWRRPKVQEPYLLPNVLALTKPVTSPFVRMQYEDLQWKAHAAQEPYVYPNALIRDLPPIFVPPFVVQQYEHHQWKSHPTQPHFDYPNLLILQITPNQANIQVPYVLALTATQAVQVLNFYTFFNIQLNFVYDVVSPPGIVIGQNPQPYTFYQATGLVSLSVSQGPFVPGQPPLPPMKVTQRNFSLEELVARMWGPSFRAPDHRVYVFSNNRGFDSTDTGTTGIYEKGIENPPVKKPPFPN